MEFDLNQEPPDLPHDPIFGLQTLLSELQTAEGRIEGRIRQLEAVISRTRQRQIWRQNQITPQTVIHVQTTASEDQRDDTLASQRIAVPIQGRMLEARKVEKKNNTHLIAKALGKETDAKNKGSFFDCNICVNMARDPVLTSCGHLFCWPCFYSWSYIGHSDVKECPVCLEKVTDKSIIPIYGNENVANTRKSRSEESGLKVPPRPNAHRIEGLRQKLRDRRISSLAVRNAIAAMEVGSQPQSLDGDGAPSNSPDVRNPYMNAVQILERSAASFASLSTALNSTMSSAERLFQDLEASINTRRISRQSSNADSTVAQIGSSSRRTELPRTAEVSNSVEVNSTAPNSSSSRRRREEVPVNSDVENDSLPNPVRRRLM